MRIAARFMAKPNKPPGTLHARTRALLNNDKRTLDEISRASGLSVYWLQKFRTGQIHDPSANKVQRLYEYLTGKALTC